MNIKIKYEKGFGPSIEADNITLFCVYRYGMWRWITADHHKKIDYDNEGYVKIVGIDVED